MNKESNVINKWVDIGVLPIYKKGRKNTYINWDDAIGIAVPFVYGDICGNATILKNVDSKRIAIYVDGYTSEDRSNKHHGHPVYVYKNDVLIKRFDSIRQCVDKSIETFGVKFDFKCVLNAYNGKRESYKGYIFKRSEEVNNTKLLKGVY